MDKVVDLIKDNLEFINVNLLKEKGLLTDGRINTNYVTLLKNYKLLFEKYLLSKVRLDEYDKKMENSELLFVPIKPEKMDCYQATSSMGLKYIYLRNYLHVEKLSSSDINRIISLSDNGLNQPSKELYDLIEATYRDVINSSFDKNVDYMCCYGVDSDRFWFVSSALVFGVRHNEYEKHGMDGPTWLHNNYCQHKFVNSLMNQMQKEISNILGIETGLIVYNDYTVKKNR